MNEFDDIEDFEIEELEEDDLKLDEKDEELDVGDKEINYKPQAENDNEGKIKKMLLTALGAFIVIAWVTSPIWFPALLELIADCFDGDGRTIFYAIVLVLLLLIALMAPSRYERFKNQSILQRFLFALSYIGFIIIAIIIAAAIEA